jgi:Domain of unknown function (DUF4383)
VRDPRQHRHGRDAGSPPWGLAAYRSFAAARIYARAVAVVYGILTVMGLIPVLDTTFGLIPLYGHDVWLHALLAIVAAYFGWAPAHQVGAPAPSPTTTTTTGRRV